MTDVTIIQAPAAEGDAAPVEVEAAAVEPVVEAAVEIAEIEANRDVRIAEIGAEVYTAEMDAAHRVRIAELETELASCRTLISAQTEELFTCRTAMASIQTPLTPPEALPPSPAELAVSEATSVSPEAHAEPPPEPARVKPHHRSI